MSFLEDLQEARNVIAVKHNEFLNRFKSNKKQVFVFYEGDEDSSYYRQFIDRKIEKGSILEEIIAECRNNVIGLSKLINANNYRSAKLLFFVDKDLTNWLCPKEELSTNVYVTDMYSVENYLVNEKIFLVLLKNFMGFGRAKQEEIDQLVILYNRLLAEYILRMTRVMAIIINEKRKRKNLKLSLIKAHKIVRFEEFGENIRLYVIDDDEAASIFGIGDFDVRIVDELTETLKKSNEFSIIGKWLLFFLVELCENFRMKFSVFAPSLTLCGITHLNKVCNIDASKAVLNLAPYMSNNIAPTLELFLDKILQEK